MFFQFFKIALSISLFLYGEMSQGQSTLRKHVDYEKLTHSLMVFSLRAGNHDLEGNQYYFTVQMVAINNGGDQIGKKEDERDRIEKDMGQFGNISIAPLAFWDATEEEKQSQSFSISGQTLRNLMSEAMLKFGVEEEEISIKVTVSLWEQNKKFFFFGEDQKVQSVSFYPIPQSRYTFPSTEPQELEMIDGKGLKLLIKVIYENQPKGP